ncbi:MAG: bifunctional DNA-formamidopyrimidine glycosylase/DNA-(apurinic or apyrimidinic site) lyase [candidate division WOR-3 bacterium]
MPELPEVETIRTELLPFVRNHQINRVKIYRNDVVGYPDTKTFARKLVNQKILDLTRKGKYLIFRLNNNHSLIIHLRLSGQLRLENGSEPLRFERVAFFLSNQKRLAFIEPRVLGRVYLIENGKYPTVLKGLKNLGLEPISPKFTYNYLKSKLANREAKIKSLLLDQSIAAGIGNIYSDEALFLAKILPTRRANTLSDEDIKNLSRALKSVIRAGIKYKGTSVSDYLRPDGSEGGYQLRTYVFNREGEKCRLCGATILKTKISNRTTRYCPKCQR